MYVDPSEDKAGSVLDSLVYGAAASSALRVDPQTGDATLKFLSQVQDLVEAMRGRTDDVGSRTPLGGGFGERVGTFNQELAAGGRDSAQDLLNRFSRELELLKDAVSRSMEGYQNTESGNARTITGASAGR